MKEQRDAGPAILLVFLPLSACWELHLLSLSVWTSARSHLFGQLPASL